MDDSEILKEILSFDPLIIGIGNTLRGDDRAGVEFIRLLQQGGYSNCLAVHSAPENYLYKIAGMPGKMRLWADVVHWGGQPGEWKIFSTEEISRFAISTHNFSPSVLVEFLKPVNDIPDYFLGIEPVSLQLGENWSETVENTVRMLAVQILNYYHQREL
ncbi:MAG: hydrogenase maturation protease [Calditrichia bacterium]